MTKAELAAVVAEKVGTTKKDADAVIGAAFEAITEALKAGDKVQITNFGAFVAKDRPERTCINPSTKEKILVKATRVPGFKAGKALKDAVAK